MFTASCAAGRPQDGCTFADQSRDDSFQGAWHRIMSGCQMPGIFLKCRQEP